MNTLLERHISENDPDRFDISILSTYDICRDTSEFLLENFRGAITFDNKTAENRYINTSPDGIAFYFKYLLNAIFGNSVVNVTMETEEDVFKIISEWRVFRELEDYELRNLDNIAKFSGFTLVFSKSGKIRKAELSAKTVKSKFIPIYAKQNTTLKKAFTKVFFLL